MTGQRRIGVFAAMLAASGYAFLPTLTRTIYTISDLRPTDIALWRFIFATPIIWLLIFTREHWQPHKRPKTAIPVLRLMPLGVFYAGSAIAVFAGLQYIPASLYIVLFYTYPAMVAVISLLTGTRLPPVAWLALGFTLVGVVLTVPDFSGLESGAIIGIVISLFNAFLVAVYFTVIARAMRGIASVARGTAWVITGALLTLLLTIPFFHLVVPPNISTWLLIIVMAAFSTAMPIFLLNTAIQMIGATQTSIIATIEPALSMTLALLVLGEVIRPIQWAGAALIIAAVLLLELRPTKKQLIPEATG